MTRSNMREAALNRPKVECRQCLRRTISPMKGLCPGCYNKNQVGVRAARRYLDKLGIDHSLLAGTCNTNYDF